ncbi:MAG: uroporphyrinogen-III synthase [Sphingobacteriales bacterium]|nr:MAG: uroporphyrinogen-III synthase [Sphingobacteriales bacterium]TAF82830.1 MAG: uroporphyrinogen-III synthase [Sphingobacteriales bacterium]
MDVNLEERKNKVKSILVTLPAPESEKSPYFDLANALNLKIDFRSFIHVEGVSGKELRKDKIVFNNYTAVILTSRNAVDHFFRVCDEIRFDISLDFKYFCLSEAIALYLQKYIQYRKRKIFFGKQSAKDLADILKKHSGDKFLYPCSDVAAETTEIVLKSNGIDFTPVILFKTVVSDLSDLAEVFYDIIVFFSPSSVQSLFVNFPNFKQNKTRLAAFGVTTQKAIKDAGLILDIPAPTPLAPSMTMAIEQYIKKIK